MTLFGPVYDLRPAVNSSLVKEKEGHKCRCTLEHQFDVSNTVKLDSTLEKIKVKQPNK